MSQSEQTEFWVWGLGRGGITSAAVFSISVFSCYIGSTFVSSQVVKVHVSVITVQEIVFEQGSPDGADILVVLLCVAFAVFNVVIFHLNKPPFFLLK